MLGYSWANVRYPQSAVASNKITKWEFTKQNSTDLRKYIFKYMLFIRKYLICYLNTLLGQLYEIVIIWYSKRLLENTKYDDFMTAIIPMGS